ncbi:MAG: hypothetical protein LKM38_13340 [Pseudomonas veronii]|nr:hypothetical protein [Pseudomonas veronii]
MNNKSTLAAFYSIVTLFTGLDMAIVIAMVWFGLETTGSTFLVGATLCVATVVPYLCEQYIGRFFTIELSMKRLLYIRLTAFAAVLGLSFTDAALLPIGFLAIAFVVGVTDYFTISTLESKNTKLVLAGLTNSDTSARLMQTSIQIGAFGGALLGGVIVDVFTVNQTLQIISLGAILSLAAILFVAATPTADATEQVADTPHGAVPTVAAQPVHPDHRVEHDRLPYRRLQQPGADRVPEAQRMERHPVWRRQRPGGPRCVQCRGAATDQAQQLQRDPAGDPGRRGNRLFP